MFLIVLSNTWPCIIVYKKWCQLMNEKIDIDLDTLNNYLACFENLSYVISEEGFPVYWSKELNEVKAEGLAALAIDIANVLVENNVLSKEKIGAINIDMGNKYFGLILAGKFALALQTSSEIILGALSRNIVRYIRKTHINCPWCGKPLELTIHDCPYCGKSIPFGISTCPFCGANIKYFVCRHCGRKISPRARKVVEKTRRTDLILGLILEATSIGFLVWGIIELLHGTIIGVPLIIGSLIIGSLGVSALRTKSLIEVS